MELIVEKAKPPHAYGILKAGKLRDGFLSDELKYTLQWQHFGTKRNGGPITAVVATVGEQGATDGSAMGAVNEDDQPAVPAAPLLDQVKR